MVLSLPDNTAMKLVSLTTVKSAGPASSVPTDAASTGCAAQNVSTLPLVVSATGCAPGQYVLVVSKSAVGGSGNHVTSVGQSPAGSAGLSPPMLLALVAGLIALVVASALVGVRVMRQRRQSATVGPSKPMADHQQGGLPKQQHPAMGTMSAWGDAEAGSDPNADPISVHVDSAKADEARVASAATQGRTSPRAPHRQEAQEAQPGPFSSPRARSPRTSSPRTQTRSPRTQTRSPRSQGPGTLPVDGLSPRASSPRMAAAPMPVARRSPRASPAGAPVEQPAQWAAAPAVPAAPAPAPSPQPAQWGAAPAVPAAPAPAPSPQPEAWALASVPLAAMATNGSLVEEHALPSPRRRQQGVVALGEGDGEADLEVVTLEEEARGPRSHGGRRAQHPGARGRAPRPTSGGWAQVRGCVGVGRGWVWRKRAERAPPSPAPPPATCGCFVVAVGLLMRVCVGAHVLARVWGCVWMWGL
jgi:hypothetical protein